MSPEIVGMVLWSLTWAMHYYVTNNVKIAQAMGAAKDGRKRNSVVTEARLRNLDAIARTIWWALLPFAAVVLGTLLPREIRELLEPYVSPAALISASLAAIFAHFAVQKMLRGLLE